MAIFTAIATAIVTAVTGATIVAGTWAAFAVSIISTGLAYATSRLLGRPGARGGSGIQDQGVRVQFPPATENKIPVVYGKAFQLPIITDARISNSNTVMTYVLTLSEKTDTGNYTIGNIYWNDQKLNFSGDGYTVVSSTTPDGTTSTNLADLVKVWVWAGGSDSAYQIKGPTPAVNAYDIIPETTASYAMTNLVFSVVQLTYNAEKNVTALPTMTYEINNSLSNPGEVIYDYLVNDRYGAGIDPADIDADSFTGSTSTSLKSVSNQIPPNQFNANGTTSTQARYVINGVLNTGDTVKNNLDRLNIASSSWLTYDHKLGQWKAVCNRAATAGELTAAKVFNDDNIIGEINLTVTSLEDLYNELEVQYPNRGTRDQSDYYKYKSDPSVRNDLEPDNTLRMSIDMVNNALHAARIGLIELLQSRLDLLINFTADYSALETEVGDIIKITNPVYNFNGKPFRVLKVREIENENSQLVAEITALEYNEGVYYEQTLYDNDPAPTSAIPPGGTDVTLPAPSTPVVISQDSTANSPNFTLQTTIDPSSGPVGVVEWFYSSNSSTGFIWLDNSIPPSGTYSAGETITDVITAYVETGTWYFKARTGISGQTGPLSAASAAFVWNPQPAGADSGVIGKSLVSDQIFVENTTTGNLFFTFSTGTSSFQSLKVDTDVKYVASTKVMNINNWTVSTNTNAVYGQFLVTGTQSIATSTSVAAVTFDESVYQDGITLTTSSHINLPETGKYIVSLSAIFENASSQGERALMWLRKNGADEPDTNTAITVPAKHGSINGTAVLAVSFVNEHSAGDYIELYWNATDSGISIKTINSSTVAPIYPRAPAVLLSVHKIAGGYG